MSSVLKKRPTFRVLILLLMDVLILAAVDGIALFVRFEFSIGSVPEEYIDMAIRYFPLRAVITVLVFVLLRMYRYMWRSISAYDVGQMLLAVVAAYVVSFIVWLIMLPFKFLKWIARSLKRKRKKKDKEQEE